MVSTFNFDAASTFHLVTNDNFDILPLRIRISMVVCFQGEEPRKRARYFEQAVLLPPLLASPHRRRLPPHHLLARRHQGGRGGATGPLQGGVGRGQGPEGGGRAGRYARYALGQQGEAS